jgi:hypothetical protein
MPSEADQIAVEMKMTPIERFTVTLAGFASPSEVHRLRLFFEEWDSEVLDAETR